MRVQTAAIVIAFLAVSPAAYAETACQSQPFPIHIPSGYNHDRWISGQRQGDLLVKFDGYTSVFYGPNFRLTNPPVPAHLAHPYWVSQEVRRFRQGGQFVSPDGFERPSPWYEQQELSFLGQQPGVTERHVDKAYAGEAEVWNRGHMATRHLVNRISPEAGCNSHTFTNAVPQFWSLNQGEWLALENTVGALANKFGKAWNISGPIYIPDLPVETIGEAGEIKVAIPHALFKVIVYVANAQTQVRAFIFPQPSYRKIKAIMAANGNKKPTMGYRNCQSTNQAAYDFAPFVASLTDIERLTQVKLFPQAVAASKVALDEMSSRGLWTVDARFFDEFCGSQ